MVQKLDYLKETASQTAGPYVHIGLTPTFLGIDVYGRDLGGDIAGPNAKGERIRVEGIVRDGIGGPVHEAVLEIWQANADGHFAHPEGGGQVEDGFRGWGRISTDFKTGEWAFETIKPGPVPGRGGDMQAPHLMFWIVSRGINTGLHTRLYFEDEAEANAACPVLNAIPAPPRRETLIAKRSERDGMAVYRFEIRLQGDGETVFFDI